MKSSRRKMPPLEVLARSMAWAGLGPQVQAKSGLTEASYWLNLHVRQRADHINNARSVCLAITEIDPETLRAAVVDWQNGSAA